MSLSETSGVAVRVGSETTFGGGPTSGNGVKVLVTSVAIQETQNKTATNELDGTAIASKSLRGLVSVSGSITMKVRAEQAGIWWTWFAGDPATTGAGPYTHTWTLGSDTNLRTFAMETEFSSITTFQQYYGMVVTGISAPVLKDGDLLYTVNVIGQKAAQPGTTMFSGTVTDLTGETFVYQAQDTGATFGTSTVKISAGNMDFTRETRIANAVDGTDYGFDVIRNKFRVDGTVTTWFENTDLLTAARSITAESLAFDYDDGTRSLTMTCPSTEFDLFSVDVDANTDAQEPAVTFEATGTAMTVVAINAQAGTYYTGV